MAQSKKRREEEGDLKSEDRSVETVSNARDLQQSVQNGEVEEQVENGESTSTMSEKVEDLEDDGK